MRQRNGVVLNVISNWTAYAINLGLSFYLTPFILSRIGRDAYGIWVLLGALLGYFALLDLGVDSAVVRHVSRSRFIDDKPGLARALHAAQIFFMLAAIVILLASLALAALFWRSGSVLQNLFAIPAAMRREFGLLIAMGGIACAFSFCVRPQMGVLKALERYDLLNGINSITALFRALTVIFLMGHSLLALGIIFATSNVVSASMAFVTARRLLPAMSAVHAPMTGKTLLEIFRYSAYTTLTSVGDQLRFYADALVIGHFLTMAHITLFNLGNLLITQLRNALMGLATPLFPVFSRYEAAGDLRQIRRMFVVGSKAATFLTALGAGAVVGLGERFLQLWIGSTIGAEGVHISYRVTVILATGLLLEMSQCVSVNFLYGISRHQYYTGINAIEGVANLILSVMLVRRYGIYGVALGTAIPMIIIKATLQPAILSRLIGVSFAKHFASQVGAPILMGGSLGAVLWWLAGRFHVSSWPSLITIGAFGGLAYILTCSFVYFSREERSWFLQSVRRLAPDRAPVAKSTEPLE